MQSEFAKSLQATDKTLDFYTKLKGFLSSPGVHFYLRDWVNKAVTVDPVDALNDAEQLVAICKDRCRALGINV